jgi:hypothetical protein
MDEELYKHYADLELYKTEEDSSPTAPVDRILAHKHFEKRQKAKAEKIDIDEAMEEFINEDFGESFDDILFNRAPESVKKKILANKQRQAAEKQALKDKALKKQVDRIVKKKVAAKEKKEQ